jgi:hypothetical protein
VVDVLELPGKVVKREELLGQLVGAVRFCDYDIADRIANLVIKINRFEENPPYYAFEGEVLGYIVDEDFRAAKAVVLVHRDKIMFFEIQ